MNGSRRSNSCGSSFVKRAGVNTTSGSLAQQMSVVRLGHCECGMQADGDIEVAAFQRVIQIHGRARADQGAEIIKIEPPAGDNLRKYPSTLEAKNRAFLGVNHGKRGLVLDQA